MATSGVRHPVLRRRGAQGGFTLVELLVALVVLAAIMVIVAAVSFSGVVTMSDGTTERESDAGTARVLALTFGRDVQGASGLSATSCGTDGTALVTFTSSTDPSETVSYRTVPGPDGATLLRTTCRGGVLTDRTAVSTGLGVAPAVSCDPACAVAPAAPPRTVSLRAGRRDAMTVELDASRRTRGGSTPPPPVLAPRLFSLGGTTPLAITGNGSLVVNGDAYVNSAAAGAVSVNGNNARLTVNGDLRILQGGNCSGCNAVKVRPFPPGSFPQPLPDPLAFLPTPSESGVPNGSCNATRCTPGVYSQRLNISGNRTLEPGLYLLRRGINIDGQGTVTGTGVTLFNGCATGAPASCATGQSSFWFGGQATINLSPPTTGTYRGITIFQSRSNTTLGSVSGQAVPSFLDGIIYVPNGAVALGAGNGNLRMGAVVGRNLTVTGQGTVTVNG